IRDGGVLAVADRHTRIERSGDVVDVRRCFAGAGRPVAEVPREGDGRALGIAHADGREADDRCPLQPGVRDDVDGPDHWSEILVGARGEQRRRRTPPPRPAAPNPGHWFDNRLPFGFEPLITCPAPSRDSVAARVSVTRTAVGRAAAPSTTRGFPRKPGWT